MSDHKRAIVPLESWCYSNPELKSTGVTVDIGLFAEALIYYETIAVNLTNQPQFAEFLNWFKERDQLEELISLVRDGTIEIYDYSFATTAICDNRTGEYSIFNIQDEVQAKPNTFEKRFLCHKAVQDIFPKTNQREKLYRTFRGRVIEVKSSDFGSPIENARLDYTNPHRNTLVFQSFVDELYHFRKLGRPPKLETSVQQLNNGKKHRITYNINFDELAKIAGPDLNFHIGTPLTASAHSNRLIW